MGKRYRHTFPFWKLKTILKSRDGDVHEVDGWEDATWCVWSCVYDDHICLSLLCSFVIVCYVFFFILFLYCWKLNFWFFFIHSCIVAKYICDFSSFCSCIVRNYFCVFLHLVLVLLQIAFVFFLHFVLVLLRKKGVGQQLPSVTSSAASSDSLLNNFLFFSFFIFFCVHHFFSYFPLFSSSRYACLWDDDTFSTPWCYPLEWLWTIRGPISSSQDTQVWHIVPPPSKSATPTVTFF